MTRVAEARRGVLAAVDRLVNAEPSLEEVLRRTAELLHDTFDPYTWVGIYLVDGDELALAAWRGPAPTAHVRIPVGTGICGTAAQSGRTLVVDDVSQEPTYLACFPSTRSEIVVPILVRDSVVGELDVDGDEVAAFGPADRAFLEQIARMLSSRFPH